MTDIVSATRRSELMRGIRGANTKPERIVRSVLHRLGFRFRLHSADLPGRPDIVLPRHRTVILVHGCFWHRHGGCRFAYTPKSSQRFWLDKFEGTRERDIRNLRELRRLGWHVHVIWECQTRDEIALKRRLSSLSGLQARQ